MVVFDNFIIILGDEFVFKLRPTHLKNQQKWGTGPRGNQNMFSLNLTLFLENQPFDFSSIFTEENQLRKLNPHQKTTWTIQKSPKEMFRCLNNLDIIIFLPLFLDILVHLTAQFGDIILRFFIVIEFQCIQCAYQAFKFTGELFYLYGLSFHCIKICMSYGIMFVIDIGNEGFDTSRVFFVVMFAR